MSVPRLLVLLVLSLGVLAGGAGAAAQEGASLSVSPPAQTAGMADGPFDVTILVDDVSGPDGLGGYTLLVGYDPAVVHALSVVDGGFVMNTENAVACPASGIDNEAGSVALFCLTIPIFLEAGASTSEPQVLARVTLEPVGEGETEIDIGDSILTDPSGNGIAASITGGTVAVVQGSALPTTVEPSTDGELPDDSLPAGDSAGETGTGAPSAAVDAAGNGLPTSGAGPASGGSDAWLRAAMALAATGCVSLLAAAALRRRMAGRPSP